MNPGDIDSWAWVLQAALENMDDAAAYFHEQDEVGYRPCCGASLLRPHDTSCWVHGARDLLAHQKSRASKRHSALDPARNEQATDLLRNAAELVRCGKKIGDWEVLTAARLADAAAVLLEDVAERAGKRQGAQMMRMFREQLPAMVRSMQE